jgi:hypothetical protein
MTSAIGRRAFLRAAGALGLLPLLPGCGSSSPASGLPAPGEPGKFLDAHALDTLRAVTARFLPGPPDDPSPGALEGRCAEAIDLLLGAFVGGVPPIHAGGPFSDRAGASHNDFAEYVPLDPLAELGWRLRIEGSNGIPEREFAGPVIGLQQIYREGLQHLDQRSQARFGVDFISASSMQQDLLLADLTDGATQEFVGAALANTLDAMYGAPEYGGNHGLAGWTYTRWPGDVQPRGFPDAAVSEAGDGSPIGQDSIALVERFIGAFPTARRRRWPSRR